MFFHGQRYNNVRFFRRAMNKNKKMINNKSIKSTIEAIQKRNIHKKSIVRPIIVSSIKNIDPFYIASTAHEFLQFSDEEEDDDGT